MSNLRRSLYQPFKRTFISGALICFSVMLLTAACLFIISLNRAHPVATSATVLGIFAYYALSTAIDLERDMQGKWSFKMRAKPAGEAAVKKLVEKLIAYLRGTALTESTR
jgi:hypothetical protein